MILLDTHTWLWLLHDPTDRILVASLTKKSKYIPKTMLNRIEQMNNEKAPVEEILKVLRDKSQK
jgi:PIN domain nuclease of toxin-antitoxin system